MKARVIKEWKMYGITHKVGEIMNIPLHSPCGLPMISDRDAFLLDNGSIEEIKEPLIKDEKIRKAVRAWAEVVGEDTFIVSYNMEHHDCCIYTGNLSNTATIDFGIGLNLKGGGYTIDELCGEEEE